MTAIVVPAGPSWKIDHQHLTLAYINSTDKEVVEKVIKAVQRCIETSWHINQNSKDNNFHTAGHDTPKPWGKNSLLVSGEIENFKKSLHDYLTNNKDSDISEAINSEYRPAHIDVKGVFDKPIYTRFRVNDLYLMSKKGVIKL